MEQQSASKSSTTLTYGLYLGIASIIFSLIIYYGGLIGNKAFSYLGFILTVVFIFLGLKQYRDNVNNGSLKYSQGLGLGVLISLVGGIVSGIFTYIFLSFIDPGIHDSMIAIGQEQALQSGATEAQLEQAEGIMKAMMSPMSLAIFGIVGSVIGGLIISLIISAILKKDPEVPI